MIRDHRINRYQIELGYIWTRQLNAWSHVPEYVELIGARKVLQLFDAVNFGSEV